MMRDEAAYRDGYNTVIRQFHCHLRWLALCLLAWTMLCAAIVVWVTS